MSYLTSEFSHLHLLEKGKQNLAATEDEKKDDGFVPPLEYYRQALVKTGRLQERVEPVKKRKGRAPVKRQRTPAVSPDWPKPRVFHSRHTRWFHDTVPYDDDPVLPQRLMHKQYFLLRYFIKTNHPRLLPPLSESQKKKRQYERDTRRWTEDDFRIHGVPHPTAVELEAIPAWAHELVFMIHQAEEAASHEPTPELDLLKCISYMWRTQNISLPVTQLGKKDQELQEMMKIRKAYWNNNPTMIAKANLFHYTNLMTELLYFIYFYWQAMFPHRLMQREEVMLSLIEMIFTKEAVEASASCTRSMTPDDLQTCVNYALYFGKAQCDPMYYIPSAGKIMEVVMLSYTWQVMLCREGYHLLLFTLNHLDFLRRILDTTNPAASHDHWGGAKRALINLSSVCVEAFNDVTFEDLNGLHSMLKEKLTVAIPVNEKQRFKYFLECGLCHWRLQMFFSPCDLPRVESQPTDTGRDHKRFDPDEFLDDRLTYCGLSVYEVCTEKNSDMYSTIDFFPTTPKINLIQPPEKEKEIVKDKKAKEKEVIKDKKAKEKAKKKAKEAERSFLPSIDSKETKVQRRKRREQSLEDDTDAAEMPLLPEEDWEGTAIPDPITPLLFSSPFDYKHPAIGADLDALFRAHAMFSHRFAPNGYPTEPRIFPAMDWATNGIKFLSKEDRLKEFFLDGVPVRLEAISMDYHYRGRVARKHWRTKAFWPAEVACIHGMQIAELPENKCAGAYLERAVKVFSNRSAVVTDEDAERRVRDFHAELSTRNDTPIREDYHLQRYTRIKRRVWRRRFQRGVAPPSSEASEL